MPKILKTYWSAIPDAHIIGYVLPTDETGFVDRSALKYPDGKDKPPQEVFFLGNFAECIYDWQCKLIEQTREFTINGTIVEVVPGVDLPQSLEGLDPNGDQSARRSYVNGPQTTANNMMPPHVPPIGPTKAIVPPKVDQPPSEQPESADPGSASAPPAPPHMGQNNGQGPEVGF